MMKLITSGKTDAGRRRPNNEDSFTQLSRKGVLAVADGMGGVASGEVASAIFADTVSESFSNYFAGSEAELYEYVQYVFLTAHEKIRGLALSDPRHGGMGCTAELLVFHGNRYILGHVGDSRTYLLRQWNFRQMTRDHSLIQHQLDSGMLTPEAAKKCSDRNIILRAVGTEESLAVDFIRGECCSGDLFLLCSDGLTDMVDDKAIFETMSMPISLDGMVGRLVEMALDAGGNDNVTIVLGQVMIEE